MIWGIPADFAGAGALISRGTFLRWTGLERQCLDKLRRTGQIGYWRPPRAKRGKYYKADAARIAGWEV